MTFRPTAITSKIAHALAGGSSLSRSIKVLEIVYSFLKVLGATHAADEQITVR
jgi:hypothetical protein